MSRFMSLLKHPAMIASAYAVVSLGLIALTNRGIEHSSLRPIAPTVHLVAASIFAIVTAMLIYHLLRRTSSERERFRALLESAPDAIVIVDRKGTITLINAQAEKLFGYSRAELIGESIERLVPERYRAQHPGHRAEMLASKRIRQMCAGLDLFARRKDGSEFPADISLSPVQTADGLAIFSDIRDISERRAAEEQIKNLNSKLEQALRRSEKLAVTGGLIATLAHEINNPLETLGNLIYLLKSSKEIGAATMPLVEASEEEVARLMTITRQTLAPHREAKAPVPTKLADLLDDVVALFDRKLRQTGIEVVRNYRSEGDVVVYPSDFRQVFTNLIANAIDAMANGGKLCLTIEKLKESEVVVRISDTGCGIASENLNVIFDPFYTTKGEQGTGIGLWVIKGIIEKVGGKIEVVSSATGATGTCFSVYLPATSVVSQTQ